jgi:hypothetical protein
MDLGFGSSNQAVGDAAAAVLLRSAQAQEKALESEISRCDTVLDDSEAIEKLRARRLEELRRRHDEDRRYRELGHGVYGDLVEMMGGSVHMSDAAKAFFDAAKQSSRMVVHFHRPSTRVCDVFHKHLAVLAKRHLETRFVSVNVENCVENGNGNTTTNSGAAFLVERLGIVVMPTLLIVKDRRSVHQLRGFDELGNTPDFSLAVLEHVLGRYGAVDCDLEAVPDELLPYGGGTNRRLGGDRRRPVLSMRSNPKFHGTCDDEQGDETS